MDIRLKEIPITFDGRDFLLRCNFNVLADVQEACGGDLLTLLKSNATLKSVRMFMAAMLNDYADEQGWPERYTDKQVGRKINFDKTLMNKIMKLVTDAVTAESRKDTESKN